MTDTRETHQYDCATCGEIGAGASASWKDSDPEWGAGRNTLPAGASRLVHVAGDAEERGGRGRGLRRCPDCGDWFEWIRGYEFLAGGTEDEEEVVRIDEATARALERTYVERDRARAQQAEQEPAPSGTDALGLGDNLIDE